MKVPNSTGHGVVATQFHSIVAPDREAREMVSRGQGDGRDRGSQRGTETAEFTCDYI